LRAVRGLEPEYESGHPVSSPGPDG
jgi:hypothetical protein